MCGIVGVAGNLTMIHEKAFKTLLELDTVRGPHSTGVIVVNTKGEYFFERALGTPWDFYADSDLFSKKGIYAGQTRALIGHNRWATTGDITVENAHPFDFENLIGVHNGTLTYTGLRALEKSDEFEVDSEALFYNIDKYGPKVVIPKTSGAYSLVWWDKNQQKVCFLRNTDRPMSYMFSANKEVVFWASESWMLDVMCKRNNISGTRGNFKTKADHLYTLDPEHDAKAGGLTYEYITQALKSKKPPVTTYYRSNEYGHSGAWMGAGAAGSDRVWDFESGKFVDKPARSYGVTKTEYEAGKVDKKHSKNKTVSKYGEINVYFNPDDEGNVNIKTSAFFIMRQVGTDKKVRVISPPNNEMRKNAIKSAVWEYFTIVPNNTFSVYEMASRKSIEGFMAQANSLKGPFDYTNAMEIAAIRVGGADNVSKALDRRAAKKAKKKAKTEIKYIGYANSMHTKGEMERLLSNGCSWCSVNDTTLETLHKVEWISHDEYVCGLCEGSNFVNSNTVH